MWLVSLPLTRLEHWTSSKVCFWSEGRVCGKCCTKPWVWKAREVEWWGLGRLQSGCGWTCSGRMKWGWAVKITLNHLLSAANLFWFSWENVMELEKGHLAAGFSSKECGGLGLVTPGRRRWKWNWQGWLIPAAGSGGTVLSKALPWCTDTLAIHALLPWAVAFGVLSCLVVLALTWLLRGKDAKTPWSSKATFRFQFQRDNLKIFWESTLGEGNLQTSYLDTSTASHFSEVRTLIRSFPSHVWATGSLSWVP